MSAPHNRYQLKLVGTGSLSTAGSKIVRITQSATLASMTAQICHLFDVPVRSKLLIYEVEPTDTVDVGSCDEPMLVSVTLEDILIGVQQYYAHGCDDSFLATNQPCVLLDAKDATSSSLTDSADKSNAEVKSRVRQPKAWVRVLDAAWPKHTPRYVLNDIYFTICHLALHRRRQCTY
jgi:hypothetical protein